MDDYRSSVKQAGISALAYGFALMVGDLIAFGLFRLLPMNYLRGLESEIDILLTGIALALAIVAIGGGFGGFIGGWTLPIVGGEKKQHSYAWRSAISMGLLYSPIVFLGLFMVSIFAYYYVNITPASVFMLIFLIIGALFGLLFGLFFGLLTLGWRGSGWVVLASVIGFGVGGLGLGYGLWAYLLSVVNGDLGSGSEWMLMLGLLAYGALGGLAIGFTFDRIAIKTARDEKLIGRNWITYIGCAGLIIAVIIAFVALRKVGAVARDLLVSRPAGFSTEVTSNSLGTHWSVPTDIQGSLNQQEYVGDPSIDTNLSGDLAIVWNTVAGDSTKIYFTLGRWKDDVKASIMSSPLPISGDHQTTSKPDVAVTDDGNAHIIWRTNNQIFYNVCDDRGCSDSQQITGNSSLDCFGAPTEPALGEQLASSKPQIAVNGRNDLMVLWKASTGTLAYAKWIATGKPADGQTGCIKESQGNRIDGISLSNSIGREFNLVYQENESRIMTRTFTSDSWSNSKLIGNGSLPNSYIDLSGETHYAWCNQDGGLSYQFDGSLEQISTLPCKSQPVLGMDSQGRMHVVWYSDSVEDIHQVKRQNQVLYESIKETSWSEPSLINELDHATQPALSSNPGGVLHLAWTGSGEDRSVTYATQVQYDCEDYELSGPALAVYDIARSEKFRDPEAIVPFCQNQYDRLLFTPYPMAEFSDEPAKEFGGFDEYNDMILEANYEVLLATMEYDEDVNRDSPGMLLAEALTELYHKVEANPDAYPRGMTVRVLLGNPPRIELNSDLWRVLGNLRQAGLPAMVNEDIGWKLELANFEGSMPHSHIKILVIDGKTAVSTGFNYQYHHFDQSHPSGKGEGTVDIGVQVTGPVAQEVQFVFDELWDGATQRYCESLAQSNFAWQLTCRDTKAVPEHVPEVLRYYLPGGDSVVFSMLRNESFLLSDNQVEASIANAQESVDVVQAMFAFPPVCMLNFLFDLCTIEQALPYVNGLIEAAKNGAEVRLLLKMTPFLGTEALIAAQIMADELEALNLMDNFELRAFPTALHAKTWLIDNEMVIIGSQNFHYTAFGKGLAEHNLGVFNPQAAEDYQRVFNFYWDQAGEEIDTR